MYQAEFLQLCLVAGWVQMSFAQWLEVHRGDGVLLSCPSLRQSMAVDGLGQHLCSCVDSDTRHRGTITQTPLKLSLKITWKYLLQERLNVSAKLLTDTKCLKQALISKALPHGCCQARPGRPVLKHCDAFPFLLCLITLSDKIVAISSRFSPAIPPTHSYGIQTSWQRQQQLTATQKNIFKQRCTRRLHPLCGLREDS